MWTGVISLLVILGISRTGSRAESATPFPRFRGRGYGSPSSDETSNRIALGKDGSIYIAGSTRPLGASQSGWGEAQVSNSTGKSDIFLAKLSSSGQLKWAKRAGSLEDDSLNDLKLTNNAVYVCGTTSGDFGRELNGSTDAFILKFDTNGRQIWERPFQFGSDKGDSCNAIDIDERTGVIYVGGSTEGTLFGSAVPSTGTTHEYIARLIEPRNSEATMEITKGRQRPSARSSSTDGIVVTSDHVLSMTTTWNGTQTMDGRAVTFLNRYDLQTLHLHQFDALSLISRDNFYGVRMSADFETGDAYIIGRSSIAELESTYHALCHSPSLNDGSGGIAWDTFLNSAPVQLRLRQQKLAVAINPGRGLAYFAGTEEDLFFNNGEQDQRMIVAPFYELNTSTGAVEHRWQRITPLSRDSQELTDLATDDSGALVFTGIWNRGPNNTTDALVGSYGPSLLRTKNGTMVNSTTILHGEGHGEGTRGLIDHSRLVLFIAFGLSAFIVIALGIAKCHSRRRKPSVSPDQTDLEGNEIYYEKEFRAEPLPETQVLAVEKTGDDKSASLE